MMRLICNNNCQRLYYKKQRKNQKLFDMGNNQSRFNHHDNSVLKEPSFFKQFTQLYQKNNQNNNFTLHQTNHFKSIISLRKYIINAKATKSEYEMFEWRKNTNAPIVKVEYIEVLKNTQKLHQNQNIQIHVYCEHLIKCIADMYNLRLDESIYAFRECLLGYQAIFLKLSKVTINKFYCGINVEGKIKTWINKNLAQNSCQIHQNIRQSHGHEFIDESSIISKIIHMVSLIANIQQTKYFFYGLQKQLKLKGYTFNNCHDFITKFVINSKITIPDFLQRYLGKQKPFSGIQISRTSRRPSRIQPQSLIRSNSKNKSLNSLHLKQNNSPYLTVKNNDKMNAPKSKSRGRYTLFERKSPNLLQSSTSKHPKRQNVQIESKNTNIVSIQNILQRSKKYSINSINNNQAKVDKISKISNVYISKQQRPSVSVVPSFLVNSRKKKSTLDQQNSTKEQLCRISSTSSNSQDNLTKAFNKNIQKSQGNLRLRSASISFHLKMSQTNSSTPSFQNMYNNCKQHDKISSSNNKKSFLNTRTTTSENRQNINSSSISTQQNNLFEQVNNKTSRVRKGSENTPNLKRETSQEQAKRSLMAFKYTFQQIIESNSCKQVEDEFDQKQLKQESFNQIQIQKHPLRINRKESDSQQQIIKLKQKTQQVLYQNQWTKTINNLPLGRTSSKNLQESIIQGTQQASNQFWNDVRLQKLQKLGRQICFSVIPQTQ